MPTVEILKRKILVRQNVQRNPATPAKAFTPILLRKSETIGMLPPSRMTPDLYCERLLERTLRRFSNLLFGSVRVQGPW